MNIESKTDKVLQPVVKYLSLGTGAVLILLLSSQDANAATADKVIMTTEQARELVTNFEGKIDYVDSNTPDAERYLKLYNNLGSSTADGSLPEDIDYYYFLKNSDGSYALDQEGERIRMISKNIQVTEGDIISGSKVVGVYMYRLNNDGQLVLKGAPVSLEIIFKDSCNEPDGATKTELDDGNFEISVDSSYYEEMGFTDISLMAVGLDVEINPFQVETFQSVDNNKLVVTPEQMEDGKVKLIVVARRFYRDENGNNQTEYYTNSCVVDASQVTKVNAVDSPNQKRETKREIIELTPHPNPARSYTFIPSSDLGDIDPKDVHISNGQQYMSGINIEVQGNAIKLDNLDTLSPGPYYILGKSKNKKWFRAELIIVR